VIPRERRAALVLTHDARYEAIGEVIEDDARARVARLAADEIIANIRVRANELRRLALIERDLKPMLSQKTIASVMLAGPPRRSVDVERLRRLVGEGKSDRQIAEELGVGRSAVTQARQRHDITREITQSERMRLFYASHPNARAVERREKIRTLLEQGVLACDVARELGVSPALVCITRKALGLPPPDLAASRRRSVQASADARDGKPSLSMEIAA
jgi:hypothetical protein